jgi:hypothetical protein
MVTGKPFWGWKRGCVGGQNVMTLKLTFHIHLVPGLKMRVKKRKSVAPTGV